MRKYYNKPIEDLSTELTAGLVRLRKGYVDAAESLIQILNPQQDYPYDFIVFRLTGFRPRTQADAGPMTGKTLRADLATLILEICDSFEFRTIEYSQPLYDIPGLAKRFNVSTKTIQRWMDGGLVARRLVFPDGKRRLAFLASSVEDFAGRRTQQITRSMKFSQMTPAERADILRRARRMVSFSHCTLSEVARRLAARTGRAVETIRYTIRRNDAEHPDMAVFPNLADKIGDEDKQAIYHDFLNGSAVPALAQKYRRTRGSIYRIINESRAKLLVARPVPYIYNPQFDLPNADELILGPSGSDSAGEPLLEGRLPRPPADLPPYLKALYEVPLLTAEQERDLFRRYNYLKHKAEGLRKQISTDHVKATQLRQVESLLLQANALKNAIVRANLRLVVSVAKKHVGGPMTLFELISDGNVSLMRAVEKFDYFRGYRFSTYATWAIIRNFARTVPRERYQMDHFSTGNDEILDIASSLRIYDPKEANLPELRESIDVMLSRLSSLERSILINHYGLDDEGRSKTLDQMGKDLGISKERVRQIELRALRKLRRIVRPQQSDLLT